MGKRILIVDDEEDLRTALADILSQDSYDVLVASDGEKGLASALSSSPDLIISDILMPHMDGWELCQSLRSLPSMRTIPFIFLSALNTAPDRILALRLGADAFIEKPFNPKVLLATVEKLIERVSKRRKVEAGEEVIAETLAETLIIDTVEFVRASGKTGTVIVENGPYRGVIYMEEGNVKHATFRDSEGEAALLSMCRLKKATVSFTKGPQETLARNVLLPIEQILSRLLTGKG